MEDPTGPPFATCSYRAWQPQMGLLVRTSLGRPKWYPNQGRDLPSLWSLTPRGWYFGSPPDEFEHAYLTQLRDHGVGGITEQMQGVAARYNADRLVLGCFEANRDDCHRGTFAAWWETETGTPVPEAQS